MCAVDADTIASSSTADDRPTTANGNDVSDDEMRRRRDLIARLKERREGNSASVTIDESANTTHVIDNTEVARWLID